MQKRNEQLVLINANGTVTKLPNVTVAVTKYPSGAATIYSDNGITAISSTLITDANAEYSYYAPDGRYTETYSGSGFNTFSRTDILLEDPATGDDLVYQPLTGAATTVQAQLRNTPYFQTNAQGNMTGLVGLGATPFALGTHVSAVLLGDSITIRSMQQGTITTQSGIGLWSWANWLIGAPFIYTHNLGFSGDVTRSIFSRISAVKQKTQVVCILTGANDVASMSASAVQGTIDATYTNVSGYISAGVASLVAAGKVVVISTILPNNNFTPSSDSRIQLLDRLNTFITSLASSSVFVFDGFTAIWDSSQPTVRVALTDALNTDKIHPTARGAYLVGKSAITAMTAAYAKCIPDVDIYDDYMLAQPLYSAFRTGTGGTVGSKLAGTGTLADGWQTYNPAGTATFTLSNSTAYTTASSHIGAVKNAPLDIDSYFQEINVTSASNGDQVRMQGGVTMTNATGWPSNVLGGDQFFLELDCLITSPVNLSSVQCGLDVAYTAGTSPADQPYQGTVFNRVISGTDGDNASAVKAMPEGYRALLRTPVLRVPENINTTAAQTLTIFIDIFFNGTGSANVKFGRPRIWHRTSSYI